MNTHTEILMDCDEMVADGTRMMTEGELTWAQHVNTSKMNVAKFFDTKSNFVDITLVRSAATWKKATSQNRRLLAILVKMADQYAADPDVKCGPFAPTVSEVNRAMLALDIWNEHRISNGETQVWGVQGLIAKLCPVVKKAVTAPVTADETPANDETPASEPEAKKSQLDVVLAGIAQLDAAELHIVAQHVAARRQLVAA